MPSVLSRFGTWLTKVESWLSLGGLVIGTGLFGWFASQWEAVIAQGWGAAALLGVAFTCLSMLAASALMLGWRTLHPLPPAPPAHRNEEDVSVGQLKERLDVLARAWVSTDRSKSEADEHIRAELATLATRLGKLETSLDRPSGGLLDEMLGNAGTRFDAIDAALRTIRTRLDEQQENHTQLGKRIIDLFRAKEVERRMEQLFEKLDGLAPKLSVPTDAPGEPLDWEEWARSFKEWEAALHELLAISVPYADARYIAYVSTDDTKGPWTFEEGKFPNWDAIQDYKKYRVLLLRYLNDARPQIEHKVRVAAKT